MKVGDKVSLRGGVTKYADGIYIPQSVRDSQLYVRYVGIGKLLVSREEDGTVFGWIKTEDVEKVGDAE